MSQAIGFRAFPPEKAAIVMGESGAILTYGDLEERSNKSAHALRRAGFRTGDVLAVSIENSPAFFEVVCAARRAGLVVVPISTRLTAVEASFIVRDSGAKAAIVSFGIDAQLAELSALCAGTPLFTISADAREGSWAELSAVEPATPISDEAAGGEMLYSSGTTGRPKGIVYKGVDGVPSASASAIPVLQRLGATDATIYLSPAPLYHSAPFAWTLSLLTFGATVIVMEKFDPEQALALIERYRIDMTQWVPTHFVRMLKLPQAVRDRYDVSTVKLAVHAAAPCPPTVKRAMIEWWGPVLLEYFGSSEQTVLTIITSEEWLAHAGSVGRCVRGKIHICGEDGEPLAIGETGLVYSEGGMEFSYHRDAAKTTESRNAHGWTTVGDIGHLDAEGYLYLTDRKSFMIISGGVNIYPQEIENLLVTHPRIADAAVIGAPDEDLGEAVTAIVQLIDMSEASEALAQELKAWMRQCLSGVKAPKHLLFRADLPRLPTGKMAKHVLRREIAEQMAQGASLSAATQLDNDAKKAPTAGERP